MLRAPCLLAVVTMVYSTLLDSTNLSSLEVASWKRAQAGFTLSPTTLIADVTCETQNRKDTGDHVANCSSARNCDLR